MYTLKGELEFDVRRGVSNAKLAEVGFEKMGRRADQAGDIIDRLAKRMFQARSPAEYLAKTLSRLGPSIIGGAVGGTALGAIVSQAKEAVAELQKLADSLDKAVGKKAQENIGGTVSKIGELTSAIEESAQKISKQSVLANIASFFMNEDANRAAESFAKAVEERIKLGDKLVKQTAEQNAQSQIASELEGKLGEVYKINLAYRKRLTEISDMSGVNDSDKERLKLLAEEERLTKTRLVLGKEIADQQKRASEEIKKTEEERARVVLTILDNLSKQEEQRFQKTAQEYKKSQDERAKAAEDANKRILDSSQKAAAIRNEQDKLAAQRSQERAEIGGGVLGASRAGVKALEVARKQRTEKLRKEDFQTQEKIIGEEAQRLTDEEKKRGGLRDFTKADVRKRLAAVQAAGEMPTFSQRITGGMQGIDPAQLARSAQEGQMEGDKTKGIPDLVSAIERLIAKVNEAPILTK